MKLNKEFVKMLENDSMPKSDIYDMRNKYFSHDNWTPGFIRQQLLSYCERLMNNMVVAGASDDEWERLFRYSHVVLDCAKYKLDANKAYEDLNIRELYDKYVRLSQ